MEESIKEKNTDQFKKIDSPKKIIKRPVGVVALVLTEEPEEEPVLPTGLG